MSALTERARRGTSGTIALAKSAIKRQERRLQGHVHGRFCFRWRTCRKIEADLEGLRELRDRATKALEDLDAGNLDSFLEYFEWYILESMEIGTHPILVAGNIELLNRLKAQPSAA